MLPRITFVVPNRGSAGGIRVTMQMGNQLLAMGHEVRIVYRLSSLPTQSLNSAKNLLKYILGKRRRDWLGDFKGELVPFHNIQEVHMRDGELVIAVGSFSIDDVNAINADVLKIRYCHGFRDDLIELTQRVWKIRMPTIAVSPMLSDRIKELTGEAPLAVIPNGISQDEYFIEPAARNAIGTIYSNNPIKDSRTASRIFKEAAERWPALQLIAFGAESRPSALPRKVEYHRNPTVEEARHLYNRSLIWLVTSRFEGFCLPVLEAMACGSCVITTELKYAPNLVESGLNGFVVPVGDSQAFLEKIDALLSSSDMRSQFAAAGQKKVAEYSWKYASKRMVDFLEEFCADCRTARF